MRSAVLSDARQTTSSRQSPKMSALSDGVALVPLFDATPAGASSVESVPVVQFHFEIVTLSSSSRSGSASHQTPKLMDGLVAAIWKPRGPRVSSGVESCAVYIPPVSAAPH